MGIFNILNLYDRLQPLDGHFVDFTTQISNLVILRHSQVGSVKKMDRSVKLGYALSNTLETRKDVFVRNSK